LLLLWISLFREHQQLAAPLAASLGHAFWIAGKALSLLCFFFLASPARWIPGGRGWDRGGGTEEAGGLVVPVAAG
jgi:hypothetical protein